MKSCFKCGHMLPLTEFYVHPQMADGHLNKCRDCTKLDVAVRSARLAATPEGRMQERARGREKYYRLYRGKRWPRIGPVADDPVKRKARWTIANAVRDGRAEKPLSCSECGCPGRIAAHHADYAKPLEVEWLCLRCHGLRHRKMEVDAYGRPFPF